MTRPADELGARAAVAAALSEPERVDGFCGAARGQQNGTQGPPRPRRNKRHKLRTRFTEFDNKGCMDGLVENATVEQKKKGFIHYFHAEFISSQMTAASPSDCGRR